MSDTSADPQADFHSKSETKIIATPAPAVAEAIAHPQTPTETPTVAAAESDLATLRYERAPSSLGVLSRYLISALILSGGLGTCYWLYTLKKETGDQPATQLIPRVETSEVTSYAGQLDMLVSGTVVPFREIRVAAEVSGNVIKKYPACEAGNFVTRGTPLLEIDPKDYQFQLETRQAELTQAERMYEETVEELEGAKRNLELADQELELAQREYERNQRIKNALSPSELDQAQRNLLAVKSNRTSMQNNLQLIEARKERLSAAIKLSSSQVKRAQLNLDKAIIQAPDDGIIVSESVQEGEFVNPGTELLTFEDTSRAEVICNLTPRDLEWIRENSPVDPEAQTKIDENKLLAVYYLPKTAVTIFEPGKPEVRWTGELERFDGIGRDSRTRTIPTRITIAEPVIEQDGKPRALVRGTYVKCRIEVQVSEADSDRTFVSIPAIALRPGNEVWIVEDEKLHKRKVDVVDRGERSVGDQRESYVVLRRTEDSLQPGQKIVTTPIPQPVDGMTVELEPPPTSAAAPGPVEDTSGQPAAGKADTDAA